MRNFISYVKINKLNKHKHTQIIPSIFQCFIVPITYYYNINYYNINYYNINYYNINYKDMHNPHINRKICILTFFILYKSIINQLT